MSALLIAVSVFVSFSRTYYLHRWFHKPNLSLLLHVHGAAMTLWIALFPIQTLLRSAGQSALHRKLGLGGMVSASPVPLFGASATVKRNRSRSDGARPDLQIAIVVLALELTQLLMFAGYGRGGILASQAR